jgi:hypothetical protein
LIPHTQSTARNEPFEPQARSPSSP